MEKKFTEVRWHGRGGQGTVTAAKILADTAMGGGREVQAFPEYGPERMGAPLRAFNRMSSSRISIHCAVKKPNLVIGVDPVLSLDISILAGTSEKTVLVLNTDKSPSAVRSILDLPANQPLIVLDATAIALEKIKKPLPNTPMLGALTRIPNLITMERLTECVKAGLGKKAALVESNMQALQAGAEAAISEGDLDIWFDSSKLTARPSVEKIKKSWQQLPIGGMITEAGNAHTHSTGGWRTSRPVHHPNRRRVVISRFQGGEIPAELLESKVIFPAEDSSAYAYFDESLVLQAQLEQRLRQIGFRDVYSVVGIWKTSLTCSNCFRCWIYCPDVSIIVQNEQVVGIDLEHCKGCGICALECPEKIHAITMVLEGGVH